MDCVSGDGGAFIGYAATLSWRGLALHYSSVLMLRGPREAVESRTTLQGFSAPEVAGSYVRWRAPRLKVSGDWEARAPAIKRTLLESADGAIEWHCLQPGARAEVYVGEGLRLAGAGYVEHLTMTIPPWRLPFDELRWGRFLSDEDELVWINWRGEQPLNLSFHNGVCVKGALLTDQGLEAGGARLDLCDHTVLRDGPLVETALHAVPGARRLFPLRILRTHERKWLSRGVLSGPRAGAGWAIHEVVRWPARNP